MFVLLVKQVSIRKYHLGHHLCVLSRSRGFADHISISDILQNSLVQSTRPSTNSGHNARNFCKNGFTTIFQVAIWTVWVVFVQPRKGFE